MENLEKITPNQEREFSKWVNELNDINEAYSQDNLFPEVKLTPLSESSKEILREEEFPEKIIGVISSEEELKIYKDAELKPDEVNGKPALIRDIDLNIKDNFGLTNLDRMERGLAPLDKNGKPIELHHIGQKNDSPLAELTQQEHRGKGNDTILHNKQKESEIDRGPFRKERENYWKDRAEQYKKNESIKNGD